MKDDMVQKKRKSYRRYRKSEVIQAIKASGGLMKNVAKTLECTIGTVREYLDRNQDLQELMAQEMNSTIDLAKDTITQAIKDGDIGAAKWYLEYTAKQGWKPDSQRVVVSFVDDMSEQK